MNWEPVFDDDDDDDVLPDRDEEDELWGGSRWALRSLRKLASPVVSVFRFCFYWYTSRSKVSFFLGLPAVIASVSLAGFIHFAGLQSSHDLSQRYNEIAHEAFSAEEFAKARLCFQKVVALDSDHSNALYGLGLIAEENGDLSKAAVLFRRAAPDDSTGSPKAHFRRATTIIEEFKGKVFDPATTTILIHHLECAAVDATDGDQAHRLLANIHVSRKEYRQAVRHLRLVAKSDPKASVRLAQVLTVLGENADAIRVAKDAESHLLKMCQQAPEDFQLRLLLTDAHLLQGQHEKAAKNLVLATQVANDDEEEGLAKGGLVKVFVLWYDHVSATAPQNVPQRLELLQQALVMGPNDPTVIQRLALFVTSGADESGEARRELKRLLSAGTAPAIVHLILGTAAITTDRAEEGERHLELAFERAPEMAPAANNLAWVIANREEPDLERARKLSESAVKLAPQHPEIRETRGQIYAKLGMTKEAIGDLEFAVRRLPVRATIHDTLAELYDELGDSELSTQHRQNATLIRQREQTPNSAPKKPAKPSSRSSSTKRKS